MGYTPGFNERNHEYSRSTAPEITAFKRLKEVIACIVIVIMVRVVMIQLEVRILYVPLLDEGIIAARELVADGIDAAKFYLE